jgi:hypothetical protein
VGGDPDGGTGKARRTVIGDWCGFAEYVSKGADRVGFAVSPDCLPHSSPRFAALFTHSFIIAVSLAGDVGGFCFIVAVLLVGDVGVIAVSVVGGVGEFCKTLLINKITSRIQPNV